MAGPKQKKKTCMQPGNSSYTDNSSASFDILNKTISAKLLIFTGTVMFYTTVTGVT